MGKDIREDQIKAAAEMLKQILESGSHGSFTVHYNNGEVYRIEERKSVLAKDLNIAT